MKVLIVDDELDISEFISYNLKKEDYEVFIANNGSQALNIIKSHKPDLVLLDIMLPDVDGIEVCQEIRASGDQDLIIVMLSARDENYTKNAAYAAGCNAYITKPISPKLLINKIKGLLNIKYAKSNLKGISLIGQYTINHQSHLITYKQTQVLLPKKQFKIFCLLTTKPGKIFSREEIYQKIWGSKVFVGGRTIDVHIRNIRAKLGQESILTVKGVGYKVIE